MQSHRCGILNGRDQETATAALGIGAVAVAIVCCVGLPAIAAFVGGLTLGAVLGVGVAVVCVTSLLLGATLFVVPRVRCRRKGRS